MQAPVSKAAGICCAKEFIKPLIEIIQPKAVVALGQKTFESIAVAYNLSNYPRTMKEAIKNEAGFQLPNTKTVIFPVFHCGGRGLSTNRKGIEIHKVDWKKIKNYLENHPSIE